MYCVGVLSLVVLAFICHEGIALSCYDCVGPVNGGCAKGNTADFVKIPCAQPKFMNKPVAAHMELENAVEVSVSCVQAKVQAYNVTVVERGCGFVPGGADFCEFLKKIVTVISCSTCTSNYCNSKAMRIFP